MELIRCKSCGEPIALRSKGIADAFTPQADKLRRKYRSKLRPCTSESSEQQMCADCYEKKEEAKNVG